VSQAETVEETSRALLVGQFDSDAPVVPCHYAGAASFISAKV
jgi:hypothetical protein